MKGRGRLVGWYSDLNHCIKSARLVACEFTQNYPCNWQSAVRRDKYIEKLIGKNYIRRFFDFEDFVEVFDFVL